MIEIEKNVPIPNKCVRGGNRQTMRKMDVGDSAVFTGSQNSICTTAHIVLGAGNYTVRKDGAGIRVWRVK